MVEENEEKPVDPNQAADKTPDPRDTVIEGSKGDDGDTINEDPEDPDAIADEQYNPLKKPREITPGEKEWAENEFKFLEKTGVKVERERKAGGMSKVYDGRDIKTGEQVILKVIRREVLHDPNEKVREEYKARFKGDALATTQLRHPNIVQTIRYSENPMPHTVYRRIPGAQDLTQRRYDPVTTARILRDIADALRYAHKQGIIHRDVKPDNIIVDANKRPYLIDFGIGRTRKQDKKKGAEKRYTLQGKILGTASYISPEQADDASDVKEATDVYSLACTAYNAHSDTVPRETSTSDYRVALSNRRDKKMGFDLWLDEAIEEKRKELTDIIENKEATEQEKRVARRALELHKPLHPAYRELWDVTLAAKDKAIRSSEDFLIARLDELIAENRIERKETSDAEIAEQKQKQQVLEPQIKSLEAEKELYRANKNDDERIKATLNLARCYEELAELTRGTAERSKYIRGAYKNYNEILTDTKVNDLILGLIDLPAQGLKDKIDWLIALENYEQMRMTNREIKELKKNIQLNVTQTLNALDAGSIDDAVRHYSAINHTNLPEDLHGEVNKITARLEEMINTTLVEGEQLLQENKIEEARAKYELAYKIAEKLPDSAKKTKQNATLFQIKIEEQRYKTAQGENDYVTMFECAQNIKKIIPGLSDEIKEEVQKRADAYMESVSPKSSDIEFYNVTDKKTSELEAELAKELETPDAKLIKERAEYYRNKIEGQFKKLDAIEKDNIGPRYEAMAVRLRGLKERIRLAEYIPPQAEQVSPPVPSDNPPASPEQKA